VIDIRDCGPVGYARLRRERMLALRQDCFSLVPGPLRALTPGLDRLSSAWLKRSPSPYVDEIAAISDIAAVAGVWFVNASYEWGCTTRVDATPVPLLRRTLDWPFPGLGRRVEVAMQDGGAGAYANITWPGSVGVITAIAAGRFAAAINQAPMFRRTRGLPFMPIDAVRNALDTFRMDGHWPAAHLLRHVFDTCDSFDAAVAVLSSAPVAKPVLFSIVGPDPAQVCLIERTQTEAVIRHGNFTIANDWHPSGPRREGYWMPRGTFFRGAGDSERRRRCLEDHDADQAFDWLRAPVLNALTRLAIETAAATGELRVVGYEPTRFLIDVAQATGVLDLIVGRDGVEVLTGGPTLQHASDDSHRQNL
jgi:hypothetical protein